MLDLTKRSVVVPCVVARENEAKFSVEGLLASIQREVSETRRIHPELEVFHLHDVSLRVAQQALVAELDFRR